jgi:hypothetical protein
MDAVPWRKVLPVPWVTDALPATPVSNFSPTVLILRPALLPFPFSLSIQFPIPLSAAVVL